MQRTGAAGIVSVIRTRLGAAPATDWHDVIPPQIPVLEYCLPVTGAVRKRPRLLLLHSFIAAVFCLVTIAVHFLGLAVTLFPKGPRYLWLLELALVLYGAMAAALSLWSRALRRSDKVWLCCCGAIYLLTIAWVGLARSEVK